MNRVVVTKPMMGGYAMQVCAKSEVTDEEILLVCNKDNPSGSTNGWGIVCRKEAETGPIQCKDYSDRTHFIVMR